MVWTDALALVKSTLAGEAWPDSAELQKICITQAKQTEGRAWLAKVSTIPLQPLIPDLGVVFKTFLDSRQGRGNGPRIGLLRFQTNLNHQSARLCMGRFGVWRSLGSVGSVCVVGAVPQLRGRTRPRHQRQRAYFGGRAGLADLNGQTLSRVRSPSGAVACLSTRQESA